MVNPYEVARIGAVLGLSTTEVIARYTTGNGSALAMREDGGCVLLDGRHCGVHAGRPLVCRLYPLGRIAEDDVGETFVRIEGHPQSEGRFGSDGTIASFLEAQGVAPYLDASTRYFALYKRLVRLLKTRPDGDPALAQASTDRAGSTPADLLEWLDIDATLAHRATAPVPKSLEARVDLHLALLEREIATFEAAGLREAG